MKLVIVEWLDSSSYSGWHKIHPDWDNVAMCISVGLLCQEDEEKVILALSKSDSGNYGDTMTIPRCCIKRVRYLKVK